MHTLNFLSHALPLWFLVLTLFFPRIGLVALWWQSQPGPSHSIAIVPLIFAVLLPRLLILFMIYTDAGLSGWFLLHAIALLLAWGGISTHQVRRRRRNDDI